MALMLLPFWTDGCIGSMEGLFFEASGTTPYHFLTAAAMSKKSSNPVRELRYNNNDAALGVPYLQALGIRYYMAVTPEAVAQAASSRSCKRSPWPGRGTSTGGGQRHRRAAERAAGRGRRARG